CGGKITNYRTIGTLTSGSHIEKEKMIRLPVFTLGTNNYTNLVAIVTSGPSSIGEKFIKRHLCVMDFPNRVMYLVPGKRIFDPDEDDMSGLDVRAIQGRLTIEVVHTDGPAHESGLQIHDEIVAI